MTFRPWKDAVEELVRTNLTQQQITLVLEIVASLSGDALRNVSRDVSRDGLERTAGAIRSARWRENKRLLALAAKANDVAASVTDERHAQRHSVTPRCDLSSSFSEVVVEERGNREEELLPVIVEGQTGPRQKVSRGTRLSADTEISPDDLQFAIDAGMTRERALQAWAEFIDYWIGVPGQRGSKTNWSATWRNRVRDITGTGGKGNGPRGPKPFQNGRQHPSDLALDLADEARRLERQAGIVR